VRNNCRAGQAYGGGSMLLDWVWTEVLPAVITALDLQLGEVTLHGFSLGGLMACYGAATRPQDFSRAVCASPSVWWNFGGACSHTVHTKSLSSVDLGFVCLTCWQRLRTS
jgi:predicted alpha/beta superfamily hydrolase